MAAPEISYHLKNLTKPQNKRESGRLYDLWKRLWGKGKAFIPDDQIAELNEWMPKIQQHFETAMQLRKDYQPAEVFNALRGDESKDSEDDNTDTKLKDPAHFKQTPSSLDLDLECTFIRSQKAKGDGEIILVRKEYLEVNNRISKYKQLELPRLFVITGSKGIGKTAFLAYLRHDLLLQGKPVIVYDKPHPTFFCSSGVYKISQGDLDSDFLEAEDDEFVRSITLLIDADRDDPEQMYRTIPLISSVSDKVLGPTVVYTTSPKLRYTKKQLSQVLNKKSEYRVMNPWTPFELEIMTAVLRRFTFKELHWSLIRNRTIQHGPLPRYVYPTDYDEDQKTYGYDEIQESVEVALCDQPVDRFRKFLQAAQELDVVPETEGSSSIFLTFRGANSRLEKAKYNQRSAFLSPHVFQEFCQWAQGRPDEGRMELFNILNQVPGYESEAEFLFQIICINK